jgi:branched-chain amino acid transport system ATP-binding protein
MLRLDLMSKKFGGLEVLHQVNLTVPDGEIFGLIGPNGAGKTTVFNLITGLFAPDAGRIEFLGDRLDGLPPYRITRAGVARTFQNIRIFKEMTLLENVLVAMGDHARYRAASALLPWRRYRDAERREREAAGEFLCRVGLADKSDLYAAALSYGEQRRLEIARALATGPKLLLLDEPAAGMNGAEKQQLMDEIVQVHESGLTLLIIEHDMRFIMGICKQIAVLNFGRMIAQGTPEEIRRNPDVIEAYLGRDQEYRAELPVER